MKNLDFHCTVVQNQRSTFSHPRAPGIDFGCQQDAEIEAQAPPKNIEKTHLENQSEKQARLSAHGARCTETKDVDPRRCCLGLRGAGCESGESFCLDVIGICNNSESTDALTWGIYVLQMVNPLLQVNRRPVLCLDSHEHEAIHKNWDPKASNH